MAVVKVVSPDDLKKLMEQKRIAGNKQFLKMVIHTLKEIEKYDPEDRLGYALGIAMLIGAMTTSIKGWSQWCNFGTMNDFTLEELKKIYPKLKELATEWLKIDCEVTETKIRELEKDATATQDDNKKTTRKSKGKQPEMYVA